MKLQTAPPPPALEAKNIHKSLSSGKIATPILNGVSLKIYPSKTYAIIGPSGCGKSTLLYILGLLDKPCGGELLIANKNTSNFNEKERTYARNHHIGFVFQFHFLLKEFTALENIMFPMKKQGNHSKSDMEAIAHSLLKDVGLSNKANRLTNQLSGGEQQRVAIARSLANFPSIILADEPTGNLDSKNSFTSFDLLYRFAYEKKQAVLIVTHNQEIAKKCDHIFQMKDGIILK